jgi:phosphoribosylamine--glycine ligase
MQKVYVAPGNAGTAREQELENLPLSDINELADWAQREKVHATVVGPEAPLAAGIVDVFRARNLRIFGPTKAAAQLESSKDFAKRFMTRHKIPTAKFQTFADIQAAHAYIDAEGAPIVVKADGLAAGKGVVVATSVAEAHAAVDMMLSDNKLGDAGARVVIEEFLDGEEASFIVMADGRHALPMATARTTSGSRMPTRGRTPAAWAPIRRPRW